MTFTTGNGTFSSSTAVISLMVLSSWDSSYQHPAYEVAIEESNTRYGHLFRWEMLRVHDPKAPGCSETTAEMNNLIGKLYYTNVSTDNRIFLGLTDMCADSISEVTPLFSEWDIPIFTVAGTPADLRNKQKYPTVLSTSASDNRVILAFARRILNKFNWTNVFLLCDASGKTANNFYRVNCQGLRTTLRAVSQNRVYDATFDTTSPDGVNFALMLNLARQYARGHEFDSDSSYVIFILAENMVMRRIMIQAARRNMTGSEFIYIYMQPLYMYRLYPPLHWRMDDADDPVVRDAFRSVLLLIADTDTLESHIPENITKEIFTKWQRPEFRNTDVVNQTRLTAQMIAGYDTVHLLSQMVHTALRDDPRTDIKKLLEGRNLKFRLSNRTIEVPTGSVLIDEGGIRVPDYVLKQLDNTTGTFEPVITYIGSQQKLTLPFNRTLWWRGGTPPANEPKCGFNGGDPGCSARAEFTGLIVGVLAFMLVAICAGVLVHRYLTMLYQDGAGMMLDAYAVVPCSRRRSFFEMSTKSNLFQALSDSAVNQIPKLL